MAKKRKAKARRTRKLGLSVKTIDLKKLCGAKNERALQAALKKACASEVAIIVHNAPFKLEAVG